MWIVFFEIGSRLAGLKSLYFGTFFYKIRNNWAHKIRETFSRFVRIFVNKNGAEIWSISCNSSSYPAGSTPGNPADFKIFKKVQNKVTDKYRPRGTIPVACQPCSRRLPAFQWGSALIGNHSNERFRICRILAKFGSACGSLNDTGIIRRSGPLSGCKVRPTAINSSITNWSSKTYLQWKSSYCYFLL